MGLALSADQLFKEFDCPLKAYAAVEQMLQKRSAGKDCCSTESGCRRLARAGGDRARESAPRDPSASRGRQSLLALKKVALPLVGLENDAPQHPPPSRRS